MPDMRAKKQCHKFNTHSKTYTLMVQLFTNKDALFYRSGALQITAAQMRLLFANSMTVLFFLLVIYRASGQFSWRLLIEIE